MRSLDPGIFDLKHTVESAQPLTFFGDIKEEGKGVVYTYQNNLIEIGLKRDRLVYSFYGDSTDSRIRGEIRERFRLDDDIREIYDKIDTDQFIGRAIKSYYGMRLTKNDPWEATLCFVISQFNNVKRIRGIVKRLVEAYGEQHTIDLGNVELNFRSFPKPEALASQSAKRLMTHGTGFRADYIRKVAQACSESFELNKLYKKDYYDAKEELMQLPGIGDKVADCILLFGYGKLQAFPIDTWIKRIVERVYFNGKKKSINEIHRFADEKWNVNAGYAQQYLFWAGRSLGIR